MSAWQLTRVIAGILILLSLGLGVQGSPTFQDVRWLWFTVFIGVNLFQSGLTRWCLMEQMLRRFGLPGEQTCSRS
jgi:hypothetical protein